MLGGATAIWLAATILGAGCAGPVCPGTMLEETDPRPAGPVLEHTLAPDAIEHGPAPLPGDPLVRGHTTHLERLLQTGLPGPGFDDANADPSAPIERAALLGEDRPERSGTRSNDDQSTPPLHALARIADRPTVRGQPTQAHHGPHPSATQVDPVPIPASSPASAAAAVAVGLAAIGLYHRISKDRLLDHPARQRIVALLEAEPGLTTSEVAERLDVCYRTARHHLEKLARFDLAVADPEGRARRWCLPGQAGSLPAPLSEGERAVLGLVSSAEGVHLSEIARRLDAAKATVKHRLDRLAERGWIEDQRVGPLRRFFATEDGLERLGRDG